jgi:hypothetical protein
MQRAIVSVVLLTVFVGCSGERLPVAEVTGRVTLEGKGVEGVIVQFEPRVADAKKAIPPAFGITDSDGRYRAFRTGKKKFGAIVGVSQVRITVPEGNAAKVHPRYSADRAFWAEINPGSNIFDIDLVEDPTASKRLVEEPAAE